MAIMLFSAPVDLPATLLARSLALHFPGWRWQCGDAGFSATDDPLPLDRRQLIMGRSSSEDLVFCTIEPFVHAPLSGQALPPHSHHLQIGQPTTEDRAFAISLHLLIAAALTEGSTDGVWLDLGETGRWMPAGEIKAALTKIGGKFDPDELLRIGEPAQAEPVPAEAPRPAYAEQPIALFRNQTRSFGRKGL